jgi:hypothetical protein
VLEKFFFPFEMFHRKREKEREEKTGGKPHRLTVVTSSFECVCDLFVSACDAIGKSASTRRERAESFH